MERPLFDDVVKSVKKHAIASFNRFRIILNLWRFFQFALLSGLILCSSALLDSTFLFNQHLVFFLGNAIIVALFATFRNNHAANLSTDADLYDVYQKYSQIEPAPAPVPESHGCGDDDKQNVAAAEATAAIEKAARQINRFQRTQSEKLKQKIAVGPRPKLRRSETENRRRTSGIESSEAAAGMEALSGEEFRRRVDEFIEEHWSKRKSKGHQC